MRSKTIALALISGFLIAGGTYAQQNQNSDHNQAESKPADNTGKNVRDRSDRSVTPENQKNSKEDIALTRKVRRAITKTDGLSLTARNVKIVTQGGKVTLRGPVKSTNEKEQIAKIAKETEGVTSVDDQLEVKEQANKEENK